MRNLFRHTAVTIFLAGAAGSPGVVADEPHKAAVHADRQNIAGQWNLAELTINGDPVAEPDKKKLTVKNDADGTWALRSEGKMVGKGTSTIDPSKRPKTIDFQLTEGDGAGRRFVGIYKLNGDNRVLCFAADDAGRPKAFASEPGSQNILVKFRRIRRER